MMTDKWRLFFALMPPDDVREQLAEVHGRLRKAAGGSVRGLKWVEEENLHITMTFLGDTPREQADQMMRELPAVLVGHGVCRLMVQGAGTFGKPEPRVLWLGTMGEVAKVQRIKGAVDGYLAKPPYNVKPETRAYAPHVTVARAKTKEAGLAMKKAAQVPTPPIIWEVDALSLVRSELTPQGAVYSVVERFGLG